MNINASLLKNTSEKYKLLISEYITIQTFNILNIPSYHQNKCILQHIAHLSIGDLCRHVDVAVSCLGTNYTKQ